VEVGQGPNWGCSAKGKQKVAYTRHDVPWFIEYIDSQGTDNRWKICFIVISIKLKLNS
jgi:hypothetical protein